MSGRYSILYDLERWRRSRTWLLLLGTVMFVAALILLFVPGRGAAAQAFLTSSVLVYSIAGLLWVRQRLSHLTLDDDALTVRALAIRRSIPLRDVRGVGIVQLSAVFTGRSRRLLPWPARSWLRRDALEIRLRGDEREIARLRRVLGRRLLPDTSLVIPVHDLEALRVELSRRVRGARVPVPARSRRRR